MFKSLPNGNLSYFNKHSSVFFCCYLTAYIHTTHKHAQTHTHIHSRSYTHTPYIHAHTHTHTLTLFLLSNNISVLVCPQLLIWYKELKIRDSFAFWCTPSTLFAYRLSMSLTGPHSLTPLLSQVVYPEPRSHTCSQSTKGWKVYWQIRQWLSSRDLMSSAVFPEIQWDVFIPFSQCCSNSANKPRTGLGLS